MDDLSKEYLISFYSQSLNLHGDRPEALRWTPEGQIKRYSLMSRVGDLSGKDILDYGCGKGDFYGFLKEQAIKVSYTGLDITPPLIELARRKYPECRFEVFDIEQMPLKEDYDYIFICGVFNNRVEGVMESMKNTLLKLFPHAKEAMVFNALTGYALQKTAELNYILPEEMLKFVLENLSPNVVLYHNFAPDDITFFVYKKAF